VVYFYSGQVVEFCSGVDKHTFDSYRNTVKVALAHLDSREQSERVVDAIRATAEDTADDLADLHEDEAMTRRALDILHSNRVDTYRSALAELRDDTKQWWFSLLDEDKDAVEETISPDATGLCRFLKQQVMPWYKNRRKELANRPLIREQAFGESLDPDKLERLGRYEIHLDRKLERTLAMLLKLKELREGESAV
jgi:hypothetical protein